MCVRMYSLFLFAITLLVHSSPFSFLLLFPLSTFLFLLTTHEISAGFQQTTRTKLSTSFTLSLTSLHAKHYHIIQKCLEVWFFASFFFSVCSVVALVRLRLLHLHRSLLPSHFSLFFWLITLTLTHSPSFSFPPSLCLSLNNRHHHNEQAMVTTKINSFVTSLFLVINSTCSLMSLQFMLIMHLHLGVLAMMMWVCINDVGGFTHCGMCSSVCGCPCVCD